MSANTIDLSGWQLWDSGRLNWFTFPASTQLGAGKYALVVIDANSNGTLPVLSDGNLAFDAQLGSLTVFNNDSDNIVLYDPNNDEYIQLRYYTAIEANPLAFSGFSASAKRVGAIEHWNTDSVIGDGSSIVRNPEGDTNVSIHAEITTEYASPGTSALPEPIDTPTNTPTETPLPTDTPTNTPTETPLPTDTPTNTPTETPLPTDTPTNTPTETPLPSDTPTNTPTETPLPTDTPTNTPTETPLPTDTPTNTPTETPLPTDTPTNTPTETPLPTDTPTNTPTETPLPTDTPTNTPTSEPALSSCGSPATLISTIQGDSDSSPEIGKVHEIEAVVIANFPDDSNGFYVQEEDADVDDNPATSEGIYVVTGNSGIVVSVGELIRIKGTVSELGKMTQLTLEEYVICSSGNVLPTGTNITLPLDSTAQLEAVEGMRVTIDQTLYVTDNYNLGRFGEITLSANDRQYTPTERGAPNSNEYIALADENALSRIILDDGSYADWLVNVPYLSTQNPETLRLGDATSGITGVIHYIFDDYRLHPTEVPVFTNTAIRPELIDKQGHLRIVSLNVFDYFMTLDLGEGNGRGANSSNEFVRQQSKLIASLMALDADVVGLMEIENNGTAIAELVKILNNNLGGEIYSYIDTGKIGTDTIAVALIYKKDSLTPIGDFATLETGTFNSLSRPPLAQTFTDNTTGKDFTVVVNHFKSKDCDSATGENADQSDGQSCFNEARLQSAIELHNWLSTNPTGAVSDRVLIIGNLNAYSMEDPIIELEKHYTNLIKSYVPESERYTYVDAGEAGVIDHAFASGILANEIEAVNIWHINSDEPRALDYNDNIKDAGESSNDTPLNNDTSLYAPDQWRSSDHDPVIVDFTFHSATGSISSDTEALAGTAITISVTDADLTDVDTIEITVTSDTTEQETITLSKTSTAGTFHSTVTLIEAPPTADNNAIEAQEGDTLTFTYIDQIDSGYNVNVPRQAHTLISAKFTELITNGSFEINDIHNITGNPLPDRQPDGWEPRAIVKSKIKCNKDTTGDGEFDKIVTNNGHCMYMIKGRPASQRIIQKLADKQVIDLNKNDILFLSAKLKTKTSDARVVIVAKVKYVTRKPNGKPYKDRIEIFVPTNHTADWYEATAEPLTLTDDVYKIKVLVRYPNTTGTMKFDAISLIHQNTLDSATPATRQNNALTLPDAPSDFRN